MHIFSRYATYIESYNETTSSNFNNVEESRNNNWPIQIKMPALAFCQCLLRKAVVVTVAAALSRPTLNKEYAALGPQPLAAHQLHSFP